jgi:hypothetical protein
VAHNARLFCNATVVAVLVIDVNASALVVVAAAAALVVVAAAAALVVVAALLGPDCAALVVVVSLDTTSITIVVNSIIILTGNLNSVCATNLFWEKMTE